MKVRKVYAYSMIVVLFLGFLFSGTASAKSRTPWFANHPSVVQPGQTVDSLLIIGSDSVVAGKVDESVIVIGGNLLLKSTSNVLGPIIVLGGNVDVEQGAQTKDVVLHLSLNQAVANGFLFGGAIVLGFFFLKVFLLLLAVFVPVLITLIWRNKVESLARTEGASMLRITGIGFGLALFIMASSMLLSITIVGIPVAILLIAITLLSALFGFTVLAHGVAKGIVPHFTEHRSAWYVTLIGAVITAGAVSLPFIGGFIGLLALFASLGKIAVWIASKRKKSV